VYSAERIRGFAVRTTVAISMSHRHMHNRRKFQFGGIGRCKFDCCTESSTGKNSTVLPLAFMGNLITAESVKCLTKKATGSSFLVELKCLEDYI
jgi:hypothetical protein